MTPPRRLLGHADLRPPALAGARRAEGGEGHGGAGDLCRPRDNGSGSWNAEPAPQEEAHYDTLPATWRGSPGCLAAAHGAGDECLSRRFSEVEAWDDGAPPMPTAAEPSTSIYEPSICDSKRSWSLACCCHPCLRPGLPWLAERTTRLEDAQRRRLWVSPESFYGATWGPSYLFPSHDFLSKI